MFCPAAIFVGVTTAGLAQQCRVPATLWERSIGGTEQDILYALELTRDNGYILGGRSLSTTNGTKTSRSWGDGDYWAVRLDANGNQLWDRAFGGHSSDVLISLQQTSDGGFVFAGDSGSGISGNKTTPGFGTPSTDYWVVRTDSNGNMLWDSPFGGEYADFLQCIRQTSDGGFIVGGISELTGGNKTSPWFGHWDGWIVRIDSNGNKVWDRSFGGPGDDRIYDIVELNDGGFILGGLSDSPVGANKAAPIYGDWDYWVIRLDSRGNKIWENTFGGRGADALLTISVTQDGGFIAGGVSSSSIGGNKTSPRLGGRDYWVILLDSNGQKQWDRSFGGTGDDDLTSVRQTFDGRFILAGNSSSDPGGNKTSPHFGGFYESDLWVVRLDESGNKLWENVYGGFESEFEADILQTSDSGFVLGAASKSPSGAQKSSPQIGDWDFWLVRLSAEPPPDGDCDGISDSEDVCPDTPFGSIVTSSGCSIEQLAPCEGPWKNHGDYLAAARVAATTFALERLFSDEMIREYLRSAAQSDCGKQRVR